jgi:hypothetical protein
MIAQYIPQHLQLVKPSCKRKSLCTPTDETCRTMSPIYKRTRSDSIYEQLPSDLVLYILEFYNYRISDYSSVDQVHESNIKLFGYFKRDPSRTIRIIFPHLDLSCAILSWLIRDEHTRLFKQVIPRSGYVTSLVLSNNMLTDPSLSCLFDDSSTNPIESHLTTLDTSNNIQLGNEGFEKWLLKCTQVQNLNLSCTNITFDLIKKAIDVMPNLKKLELRGMRNPITSAHVLSIDKKVWSRIQSVDLAYNDIGDAGAAHLLQSGSLSDTHLLHLNLTKNNISELSNFGSSCSLNYLNLSMNTLTEQAIRYISRFISVSELLLYRCHLTADLLNLLCTSNKHITKLNLSDNEQLGGYQSLKSLRALPLSELVLDGVDLSQTNNPEQRLRTILDITSIGSLQKLSLESCNLDDWSTKLLIYTLPASLNKLNLSHNHITDECLTSSITLRYNFVDMDLNLSHTNIGDVTCSLLPIYFPNTRVLDVSYTNIHLGAAYLFQKLNSIHTINLRGNRMISDETVLSMLLCKSLRNVNMSKNSIHDAGAYLLLSRNRYITHLDLRENYITDKTRSKLNKVNPLIELVE